MAETLVVEQEDYVVQLRVADACRRPDSLHHYGAWIDCHTTSGIEHQRSAFPNETYREIVVTDAHQEYDESTDQPEFLTSEDEIDYLKERIMNLEQELLATRGPMRQQ